jgi:hypothetical protein
LSFTVLIFFLLFFSPTVLHLFLPFLFLMFLIFFLFKKHFIVRFYSFWGFSKGFLGFLGLMAFFNNDVFFNNDFSFLRQVVMKRCFRKHISKHQIVFVITIVFGNT